MNCTKFRSASVLCVLLVVTGCVSTTPYLDNHFKEPVEPVTKQQIPKPGDSRNTNAGMNGKETQGAYKQYLQSYTDSQPNNIIVINVH